MSERGLVGEERGWGLVRSPEVQEAIRTATALLERTESRFDSEGLASRQAHALRTLLVEEADDE